MADVAPVLRSPRGSLHGAIGRENEQYLPWKIAFRVQFQSEKFGLRFHPAQFPDTGNGIYTVRVLELNKSPHVSGPAQQYNAFLKPGQEHLELRAGLYLTHINDTHLLDVPCEQVISSLQTAPRPTTLRFIDVEAGVVTPHELRDSTLIDVDPTPVLIDETTSQLSTKTPTAPMPVPLPTTLASVAAVKPVATPHSPVGPVYKIILLGTTGVGKSSLLAVGVHGDGAYVERRATTLEAEFGSVEIPDPDMTTHKKIKARIWDTAGQERYRAITRSHYRRADGALLVYDVAEPDSFEKLGEWLKTLRETAGDSLKTIMVVENKIDQLPEGGSEGRPKRFVSASDVRAFCETHGMLFARTTAKRNHEAFKWAGQSIADALSTLLLQIHATSLTRALHDGTANGGTHADAAAVTGTIELTAAAMPGETKKLGDCGSCGRS